MSVTKTLFALLAVGFFAGCFRHQEAPERPVTASSLADAARQAQNVQRVVLNGNKLHEIPGSLASMPSLTILYLRENSLTNFSALASMGTLEELDLSRNQLGKVPSEIEALHALRHLYLSDCGLKGFPGLASLASLEYLNLDRNAIEELPEQLPPSLRWLRLNENKVKKLPDSIGSLSRLQRLYLEGNRLSALPDSIGKLTLLEDVDLSGNAFSVFPDVLLDLPKLRNLDLRGNAGLQKLPEQIGKMKSLRTLVLAQCPLSKEERARVRAALPHCVINF